MAPIVLLAGIAIMWLYMNRQNPAPTIGNTPPKFMGPPAINPLLGPNAGMGPAPPGQMFYDSNGKPVGSTNVVIGGAGGGTLDAPPPSAAVSPNNLGGGGPGAAGALPINVVAPAINQTQPSWQYESQPEDLTYSATPNTAGVIANDFRGLGNNHGARQ